MKHNTAKINVNFNTRSNNALMQLKRLETLTDVDGVNTTNESTMHFWCARSRTANFSRANEHRARAELKVNND